uniref:Uncharacterized protein n=1 Tax=Panagrolaimus sp. ES5 TaxID=591445 RepID=A0AC34GLF9_9BILA
IFSLATRVIHNHDLVPHLPVPSNQSNLYHHIVESWYPNDMQVGAEYIDCRHDGEDPKCSNSLARKTLTFDDHYSYYGRNMIDYGINGCSDLGMVPSI